MNNKYPALIANNQEPEYKKTPPLPISSVGTENTKKNVGRIPHGAALLTNTGDSASGLKGQGINYIIHATPMPEGNSLETFVEMAAKAIQNSIILAEREGIRKLATCFLGGKIYCRNDSSKPPLAEGIIRAALNQLKNCPGLDEIIFVDFDGNYYQDAWDKLKKDSNYPTIAHNTRVKRGDLCKISTHGAEAIVNSENPQMGWGGGISGAIKTALGSEASNVDRQRQKWRDEFNSLIKEEENSRGNNNSTKISFQARYQGIGPSVRISDEGRYFLFISSDNKYKIEIRIEHPIFQNPPYFWKTSDEAGQQYLPVKITLKETDKDKKLFEEGDFVEIEEIKRDNGDTPTPNGNDQNQPTKNDDGQDKNDNQGPDNNGSDNDKSDNNQKNSDWREKLKEIVPSLGENISNTKLAEWKNQKGFETADKVKNLLSSVKDNPKFTQEIQTKNKAQDLTSLIANNSPQEVITIVKRFEYDNLSSGVKENKNQKIKAYYQKMNKLARNGKLTEEQINQYLYKQAVGEINESSIQVDKSHQNAQPSGSNFAKIAKIGGVILLVLVGGVLLVLFIRKRKNS